jgi:hypothetical protein
VAVVVTSDATCVLRGFDSVTLFVTTRSKSRADVGALGRVRPDRGYRGWHPDDAGLSPAATKYSPPFLPTDTFNSGLPIRPAERTKAYLARRLANGPTKRKPCADRSAMSPARSYRALAVPGP